MEFRITTTQNTSNQANLKGSKNAELCQINLIALLGSQKNEELNRFVSHDQTLELSIKLNKKGQLEVYGNNVNDDEIRVFSDRNETLCEEGPI